MSHMKLLAVKFIACLALLYIVLGLGFGMNFGNVLMITLVLGVFAYAGDMLIMPRIGNIAATIADFALSFVVIYFMSYALADGGNWFTASLIAAAGTAVFEYFYHRYVRSEMHEGRKERKLRQGHTMQTEASEESFPFDQNKKDE
ncbi:YndM family protein [Lentibacillus sediminis]|uniref:YndM family protein n=1 Tax=Lentibacillus sediminis TaxID=1940529 RepID=UPI000C1C3988|nr:YndM family protein [Lentibacillus sediminis]